LSKTTKASPRPEPSGDALSQDELRAVGEELAAAFPPAVEETEVVLMEVDPHRLHAYWHVTPADLAAARERLGDEAEGASLVLRLHDRTAPGPDHFPHPAFDVEVEGESGHRYVELWRDAGLYLAELGLRTGYGRLVGLARSNPVQLSRAGHSPRPGSRVLRLERLALEEGGVSAPPPEADSPAVAAGAELRTLAPPPMPLARAFPLPGEVPPEPPAPQAAGVEGPAPGSMKEPGRIEPPLPLSAEPRVHHRLPPLPAWLGLGAGPLSSFVVSRPTAARG
jgi:hypothetical protein